MFKDSSFLPYELLRFEKHKSKNGFCKLDYNIFKNSLLSSKLNSEEIQLIRTISRNKDLEQIILCVPVLDSSCFDMVQSPFNEISKGEYLFVSLPSSYSVAQLQNEVNNHELKTTEFQWERTFRGGSSSFSIQNLFQFMYMQTMVNSAYIAARKLQVSTSLRNSRFGHEEVLRQMLGEIGVESDMIERGKVLETALKNKLISESEESLAQAVFFAADAAVHIDLDGYSRINAVVTLNWLVNFTERNLGFYPLVKSPEHRGDAIFIEHPKNLEQYRAYCAIASQLHLHRVRDLQNKNKDKKVILTAITKVLEEFPKEKVDLMRNSDKRIMQYLYELKKTSLTKLVSELYYESVENIAIFTYYIFNMLMKNRHSSLSRTSYNHPNIAKLLNQQIDWTINIQIPPHIIEDMKLIEIIAFPNLINFFPNIERKFT